ncbi:MAG TPA: type VII secretion protein EccCa [Propionibacteriaceae bacterium]|nr:type VII secretion protein EccCa [Propionibacteriaceae bacterium]
MTLKLVHRPTRITRPLKPEAEEVVAAPPTLTDGQVGGLPVQTFLPVIGALSSVVMIVVLRNSNPIFLVIGALLLLVALIGGLALALSQRGNAVRTRRIQRENYLDFLEKLRARMRARAREVRTAAGLLDPDPAALLELVRDPARLWERRRAHADFLRVRLGSGTRKMFDLRVPEEENPVQPYDPIMANEAEAVVTHYGAVPGMPVTVNLDGAGQVAVIGPRERVLAVARSLIIQTACLHAPDDVRLAAAFPDAATGDWQGFDRLPHAVDPQLYDGPVPARRIAPTTAGLTKVLGQELGDRAQFAATAKRSGLLRTAIDNSRLVVFLDDYGHLARTLPVPDADLSLTDLQVTTVHLLSDRLHEPSDVTVRITLEEDGTATITDARLDADEQRPVEQRASIDDTSVALFEAVATTLTPLRLSMSRQDEVESASAIDITDLLGLSDLALVSPERCWQPRSPRDFLRVPIGLDDFGAPVLLDLKESAELGMGPHGICIGATGSGKSELLRTLITALALSHPPEDLSMVLVDYKGGAAFAPFNGLPHVAGIIDNLADDPQLTQRARASINGEVIRRQELLRDAGSSPSISHYRELRLRRLSEGASGAGPDLPPLPHLFIVIDEFGELLTAEPDFIDLLITIGRIGRSIGVHLLLSSQRIEAGKLRGLDTYLSYRIGLRTFSESESSVVLDTNDAFHLPAIPGYGYLKVDTSVYRRFRSGYVSGPVPTDTGSAPDPEAGRLQPLLLPTYNGLARNEETDEAEEELTRPEIGRPLVAECVDRLRAANRQVRPVWLPPLPARLALSRVLVDDDALTRPDGAVLVPMGLIDNPAKQRQEPWLLDLGRGGGHVAVLGAPQSGRSTFLRTMAASLALSHTPREVSIYGMDLSGGGLRRIESFPHVGGVATRAHRDRLLRLLEELQGMLAVRERVFRDRGIDSLAMLRDYHAAGRVPELVSAEVVLLVDGLGQLRSDFEELEDSLVALLQRGGSFGLHLVVAMTRWNDLRMAQQPLIGTKLELRLNDPTDSVIARKLAATIRADQPGRLLTEDSLFAQVALPVLDDVDDGALGQALEALAARTAASWEGPAAAPIRLLPTDFAPTELPDALEEPDLLPFGLRQDTMEPALLELGVRDQHLIVYGDQQSGKTTVLRGLVRSLLERQTPDELVLAVMDIRGDLAAEVPEPYLGGHATNAVEARNLSSAIAGELQKRSTDPAAKLAGPRIVVIADDYDILASGGTEPLKPLLPYLPSARDLRVHVLLSRPVAGASRSMYDVAMQTVRDTGGSTLILSGERSEGQILPQVYAEQMVPGRGKFVRRGERPRIVQVANFEGSSVDAA